MVVWSLVAIRRFFLWSKLDSGRPREMRKNWIKLPGKDTDKGHKYLSVQMLGRDGILVDTASGNWRACHVAALLSFDQGPQVGRAHE